MASQSSRDIMYWRPGTLSIFLCLFLGSALLSGGIACATRLNWTPIMLDADEVEYYDFAGQIVQGSYEVHPRRVMGYTLVLAALRKTLGDRVIALQLGISLLFSLTAPLTYLLARRELGSQRVALLAGLGVMVWPVFLVYGATLYSETLALPIFIATLLTFPGPHVESNSRAWCWMGAGAMLGLCMHVRPMYLLFSPFAALVACWRERAIRPGLISVALLATGSLLVVLPWSVFLSLREGSVVLLSSNGGETLAGGLNPELLRDDQQMAKFITPSGRITWVGPGKWLPPGRTGFLSPADETLPYTKQSKLLFDRALMWIRKAPGDALFLEFRKLTYMWAIYPFWNGRSQSVLGNCLTIALLALAIAALVRLRCCFRELSIFWTLPLFVSVVALISWGSWRFRQPGDLGLIVLAATLPWSSDVKRFLQGVGSSGPPSYNGQSPGT